MLSEEFHLSDQELLLAVDGELAPRDAVRVQSHLAACWTCRARKQEIEGAISEFIRVQRQNLDMQLPPADGPRAMLKAQLAQLAETQPTPILPWRLHWSVTFSWALAAALVLVLTAYVLSRGWAERPAVRVVAVTIPNPSLTPGATVLVSRGEVCRESNTKNKVVPVALQRRVFDEYGIRTATPSAYEVDYLITPALGGADDIHNLWPQSYAETVWNAQVKDALEDHLRDLVCDGQLDLATAQREIAANWIDAYKKYFHTDRPLSRFR
jgi:Putative zinc-finger